MTALEHFKIHLKYEKNPRSKEAITLKVCIFKGHLAGRKTLCKLSSATEGVIFYSSRNIYKEQRISKRSSMASNL